MKNIISVGGIGGSGTRMVAKALQELGYFIGNDLNKPLDNLLFTLLFKRQNILTLDKTSFEATWMLYKKLLSKSSELTQQEKALLESLVKEDRTLHELRFLKERVSNIEMYREFSQNSWAWKEPNTHIVIEKLLESESKLKFIYVYRNGLDMAHSSNQNQLKLWGPLFFNSYQVEITPQNSLKYWVMIHKRMLLIQKQYPHRILFLEFESFCTNVKEKLEEMAKFCEVVISTQSIEKLESIIVLPSSVGRYKSFSLDCYHMDDLEYVRKVYPSIGID